MSTEGRAENGGGRKEMKGFLRTKGRRKTWNEAHGWKSEWESNDNSATEECVQGVCVCVCVCVRMCVCMCVECFG